ncbi:MAG: Replication factor A [Methanosaeta sp. PtaB.Bin039]|nr:MAG: Replication factor A [Methanosaeta sp. PtaB.Bin039]HOT07365.1 replication protein A [Methanotrichaceae archaeon]HQF17355.1 replication protein A [Methanotrichaceae archaeon]HQI91972.1 replication protein A [Methanotrichaceae archaeon]
MDEVDRILSRLRDAGLDVGREEIEKRYTLLVEKFHVPQNEARRSVLNYFLKEHGLAPARPGGSELVKVSQIKEPGRWVDLEARVISLGEPGSQSISQMGILGDETGTMRFVKWAKAGLPDLVEGKSYRLKKAVTDEYQGRFSIKLNRASQVEEMDREVQSASDPSASSDLNIVDINQAGLWINLKAKAVQILPAESDAISQAGVLGDGTGTIRFVKWAKSELPDLVEGKSYSLKNVVTDEYQGRFNIKLNRTSRIEELDQPVEAVPVFAGSAQQKIGEIDQAGRWIDLKAKVIQLWDANNESISQSGLLGDDTGVVKFVKWAKAELPDLVEGKSYSLKNVVTDEYQGRFSIKLNRTSQIEETDEQIDVVPQNITFTGAIVDIQKGSGLIKRCPLCKRSLAKGICGEHGKVEGVYDLRIKAAMDDGDRVQDLLINRERTEGLIGLSLERAKEMAMEALDHEVILGLMEERLVGRYYTAKGPRIDRYLLVESIEEAALASDRERSRLIELTEEI